MGCCASKEQREEFYLRKAAKEGDLAELKRLVEKGVNFEAPRAGGTALIFAATAGNLDCLEYLIAQGAGLEVAGHDDTTALMMASATGNLGCVEHLIAKGANIEATSKHGARALLIAAVSGSLGCLEHLIAKGAKLEATSNVSAAPPANPSPLSPLSGPPPSLLAACAALRSPPPLTACAATPPRLRRTASRPSCTRLRKASSTAWSSSSPRGPSLRPKRTW